MSTIAEQVGRVVGGRYRLLAPVGAGASSQVFAASDARLGRRVAVKLLHPTLTTDGAFLRRFRAEARLAASLDHPAIMRVFDWGEEDGGPYLVLELLGGGSLRALLDTGYLLSPSQAALLGSQAAAGLAYAHRRGIVHRDIKPGNLLFDEEGHVRIADFGVARAMAEAAVTEPLGAVFGTARYASPEQAEGRPLDDRTDVYSLALVLYESLTGRVPFSGDTVPATLMARVGATLPPARELGPLAPILAQAAISEPLARLEAALLAADLDELRRDLPPPEPLPIDLIGNRNRGPADALPHTGLLPVADRPAPRPTVEAREFATPPEAAPPRAPAPPAGTVGEEAAPDLTLIGTAPGLLGGAPGLERGAPGLDDGLPGLEGRSPPGRAALGEAATAADADTTPGTAVPISAALPSDVVSGPPSGRRRRWPRRLTLGLAAVLVLAGAGTAAYVTTRSDDHRVPALTSLTLAQAKAAAERAGFRLDVTGSAPSFIVATGDVLSQSVPPGRERHHGSLIRVVLSTGLPFVAVPDEVNRALPAATGAIAAAHLQPVVAVVDYSETVPAGRVIGQSPTSGTMRWGSKVTLVESKGPHPRVIPELGHGSYESAASALSAIQLQPVEVLEHSTVWPEGDVIDSSPPAGSSVKRGSTVDVIVSSGPPLVPVPDIYAGESLSAAESALRAVGLVPVVYGIGTAVVATYPSPGSTLPVGRPVYLYTI